MSASPRIYAIGDVHGHYPELIGLITQLINDGTDPARDTVVFLGDYVDSGPDPRKVIEALIAWEAAYPQRVFLRGNHEAMTLAALAQPDHAGIFYDWFDQGGMETYASYLPKER